MPGTIASLRLDARQCNAALANPARLGDHCDRARADPDVYLRNIGWYRRRLAKRFHNVDGGVFVKKPAAVTLWSLETIG